MSMTYQQAQPQPQTIPTPPTGPTPPSTPGGGGSVASADVEAAFIGNLVGGFLRDGVGVLLKTLRDRVSASGATDPASIQQEFEQTQAAFLNILGPILKVVAPVALDLLGRAVSGQAAGGAGTQAAGVPPQVQYTR